MGSYWDYLKRDIRNPLTTGPAALIHAAYDKFYDESHGSKKYYLSKLPVLSWNRRLRDAAQAAQDRYDNTGTDPAYSTRLVGPGFESVYGGAAAGGGIARMASSLSTMYTPEVIEDVSMKFNGMYR